MSNARSPRDVCSTTIGISGLMVLALFRLPGLIPPGKCKAAPPPGRVYQPSAAAQGASGSHRLTGRRRLRRRRRRRPELLARGGPLGRDRHGGLDEALERLVGGDVVAQLLEAPGLAQLRRAASPGRACGRARRARRARERRDQLLVGRLDLLRGDDRRDHRLLAQRALGARLRGLEDLLLGHAADAQVGLLAHALVGERVQRRSQASLARASTSASGTVTVRGRGGGVEHRLAELALDGALVGLEQPRAHVLAQLLEGVEARGVERRSRRRAPAAPSRAPR